MKKKTRCTKMVVTDLTEHFFCKKFCDSQASKMKKKWVYKNCVTENFFSIFIFFSETLNGHVRQKNEVYKNDWEHNWVFTNFKKHLKPYFGFVQKISLFLIKI